MCVDEMMKPWRGSIALDPSLRFQFRHPCLWARRCMGERPSIWVTCRHDSSSAWLSFPRLQLWSSCGEWMRCCCSQMPSVRCQVVFISPGGSCAESETSEMSTMLGISDRPDPCLTHCWLKRAQAERKVACAFSHLLLWLNILPMNRWNDLTFPDWRQFFRFFVLVHEYSGTNTVLDIDI